MYSRLGRYIILLLIMFLAAKCGFSQIMQQNNTPGGYKFKALKADSFLVVPSGADTGLLVNPKYGESTTGALKLKTSDSTLWAKVGQRWVKIGGNGSLTGDTAYYLPWIDTTGQSNYRVLFAINNKIYGSPSFTYDSTNGILKVNYLGAYNPSYKLIIGGNAFINGTLAIAEPTVVYDTAYKPLVRVPGSAEVKQLNRWPGAFDSTSISNRVDAAFYTTTQIDDTTFTINRPNGTKDTVTVSAGGSGSGTDTTSLSTRIDDAYTTVTKLNDSTFVLNKPNGGKDTTILTGGARLTGSGVATRVAFWDGTSSLSSNANLYWDNVNSRLGITDSTPSYRLDLGAASSNEAVLGSGSFILQNYATNNVFFSDNIYFDGAWKRRVAGAGGLFYFNATEGQFRFYPSGTAGSIVLPEAQFKVSEDGIVAFGNKMSNTSGNYAGATVYANTTSVSIGKAGVQPHSSAVLELDGTTRGFLPPRMTATQRNAISGPATGLQLVDTDSSRPFYYTGSAWKGLAFTSDVSGTNIISYSATGTDGNITAAVGTAYYLPPATLTQNRTFTMPTGAELDLIEIYNLEAGYLWNLAGASVYLSDGATVVTSLLANTNYLIRKISGKWRILN